jgi:hypothetical protein
LDAGATAALVAAGITLNAIGVGPSTLFGEVSTTDVQLVGPATLLQNAPEDPLIADAHLASIGDVRSSSGGRRRWAALAIGLPDCCAGGTEWVLVSHLPGEAFTLIEPSARAPIEAHVGSIGTEARVDATGVGDPVPVVASAGISGQSLLPATPAHLCARRLPGGDVAIVWARRSRLGRTWSSGADTPQAQEWMRYRLNISD